MTTDKIIQQLETAIETNRNHINALSACADDYRLRSMRADSIALADSFRNMANITAAARDEAIRNAQVLINLLHLAKRDEVAK